MVTLQILPVEAPRRRRPSLPAPAPLSPPVGRGRSSNNNNKRRHCDSERMSSPTSVLYQYAMQASNKRARRCSDYNSHYEQQQSRGSSSSSNNKKKRVCFANMATVQHRSYDAKDLEQSWYKDRDYINFEKDNIKTVCKIRKLGLEVLDSNQYTVTGLEKQLNVQQTYERRRKTTRHVQYVLNRQHDHTPIMLKEISELFSKQELQRAHLRGILDEALLLGM